MIKHKSHIKLALSILMAAFLAVGVAGCSPKKPLTKTALNREFNENTTYVLKARALIAKQVKKGSKDTKIELDKKDVPKLLAIKKELNNSKETLQKANISDYPSRLVKYNSQVLAYVNLLESEGSTAKAKAAFHKVVNSGESILIKYQDSQKVPKLFAVALQADAASGYELDASSGIAHATKSETFSIDKNGKLKKVKNSDKSATSSTKNSQTSQGKTPTSVTTPLSTKIIKINPFISVVLLILSILIIILVFLQPNKNQDSMNALTETGGDTIFSIPKEKGYKLFLTRSTEILIAALTIILIIYNWKG